MDYQELNLQKETFLLRHIEEGIDNVTAEVSKIKTTKISIMGKISYQNKLLK